MKSPEQYNEEINDGFVNFVTHEQLDGYSQINLQNNKTLLAAANELINSIELESDINLKKKLADNFAKISNVLIKEDLDKEKYYEILDKLKSDGLITHKSFGYP